MLTAALGTSSQALWYLSRGSGLVAVLLLSIAMVLGLTEVGRFTRPGWPRFVTAALHRNVSLLAVALLAVHVIVSVVDTYVTIRVVDVFVPLVGSYRPLWLGLGALSLDLMVAVVATSIVRGHLGYRGWRAVHLTAYACWPLAVIHGLGIGTDTRLGWVQLLNAACATSVVAALLWRLSRSSASRGRQQPLPHSGAGAQATVTERTPR